MALITKIKKFIFLISKKKYGSIGKKTYIISPIGIVGKKRIFLGNNVVINEFSRIITSSAEVEYVRALIFESLSFEDCGDLLSHEQKDVEVSVS